MTPRRDRAAGGYTELASTWRARPATTEMRLIPHPATCPDCGSTDVGIDQVDLGDGIEETAYVCEAPDCGAAWPLACICEWS